MRALQTTTQGTGDAGHPVQQINFHGPVGQVAGRDINNAFTVIVQEAEKQLDARDIAETDRENIRKRLRALGSGIGAAGKDAAPPVLAELLLRFAGVR